LVAPNATPTQRLSVGVVPASTSFGDRAVFTLSRGSGEQLYLGGSFATERRSTNGAGELRSAADERLLLRRANERRARARRGARVAPKTDNWQSLTDNSGATTPDGDVIVGGWLTSAVTLDTDAGAAPLSALSAARTSGDPRALPRALSSLVGPAP
jgi:hypothetical protein